MSEMSSKIVLNVVSVSSELLGCHFMHSYNIRLISIKMVYAMYTSPPWAYHSRTNRHYHPIGKKFPPFAFGQVKATHCSCLQQYMYFWLEDC